MIRFMLIILTYTVYFNALLAMLNARDAIRGEVHTHFMGGSQFRGTGDTSQNSDGSIFKMSRLLPLGRAKNRLGEGGELSQAVIGRLEDSLGGPIMLADRSTSTLKVSFLDIYHLYSDLVARKRSDGGVVVNVQTDMVHQTDLDTDDGRSDKFRSV